MPDDSTRLQLIFVLRASVSFGHILRRVALGTRMATAQCFLALSQNTLDWGVTLSVLLQRKSLCTEISSTFISQEPHQLSTCEPSRIRYHVRGVCSSKSYLKESFHAPRWGCWFWVMHGSDRWKCGVGGSSFLVCHPGCYCC